MLARFELVRDIDETGISGTGVVAYGVRFWNDVCVMQWDTATTSIGTYTSMDSLIAIHGHGGKTRVRWIDQGV